MTADFSSVSTKPYLIRAICQWCKDCRFRPFIAVRVDEWTVVPKEFVRNGEIVLNISEEATANLVVGNDWVEFEARFGGVPKRVAIPVGNISAVFAQENGQGMTFEVSGPPAGFSGLSPSTPRPRPRLLPEVLPPVGGVSASGADVLAPSDGISSQPKAGSPASVPQAAEKPPLSDSTQQTPPVSKQEEVATDPDDSPPPPPPPRLTRVK